MRVRLIHGLRGGCAGFFQVFVPLVIERGSYTDIDRELLPCMAFIYTSDGRDIAVISAVGETYVLQRDILAERRVKPKPAERRQENLYPSVRCLSADYFLATRSWRLSSRV